MVTKIAKTTRAFTLSASASQNIDLPINLYLEGPSVVDDAAFHLDVTVVCYSTNTTACGSCRSVASYSLVAGTLAVNGTNAILTNSNSGVSIGFTVNLTNLRVTITATNAVVTRTCRVFINGYAYSPDA
jgi:hypothetical protein